MGVIEPSIRKVRPLCWGLVQCGPGQIDAAGAHPVQTAAVEEGPRQVRSVEPAPGEVAIDETSTVQRCPGKVGAAPVHGSVLTTLQALETQARPLELETSKICPGPPLGMGVERVGERQLTRPRPVAGADVGEPGETGRRLATGNQPS